MDVHTVAGQVVTGSGVAGGIFAAVVAVARTGLRSARAQGARLGALEQKAKLERTRRLQTEAVLAELGVPLPPWPGDPSLPQPRRPAPAERYEEEDQGYEEQGYARPPVPPLPDDDLERVARHRRRPAGV